MEVSRGRVVLAVIPDALSGRSPLFRLRKFFADTEKPSVPLLCRISPGCGGPVRKKGGFGLSYRLGCSQGRPRLSTGKMAVPLDPTMTEVDYGKWDRQPAGPTRSQA